MSEATLYQRLGGYDAIAAVCADLLPRLQADPLLERFWLHRGEDGIKREYQLLVDFLCNAAGGPMYYTGRDMKLSHKGHAHQRRRLGDVHASSARHAGQVRRAGARARRRGGIHRIDAERHGRMLSPRRRP